MQPRSVLVVAAVALFQVRCGLVRNRVLDEPLVQVGSSEPTAFLYAAEVRDWRSLAAEPAVSIEYWSEDPTYTPTVALDGSGGFSVVIERCAERSTASDDVAQSVLVGGEPSPCHRWRGSYLLRARAGSRCSNPFGGERGAALGPVLWLRPCDETGGSRLAWRSLPPG